MSLGLLPSVLSHARRILTKVLRLDTDYTTTRAGYLDNIEASNFTTRVQAGMTAQGYTTSRAPNLDNLDATVSSRLSDANASTRVQTGMTSQGYTTARAGYIDNIESSNFTTRVQAGLNANGYTTTVSGRIDEAMSTRRQRMRTQPAVSNSSSGNYTLVNVSGTEGVILGLHHDQNGSGSGGTASVVIDGVTVASFSASGGSGTDDVAYPDGTMETISSGSSNPHTVPQLGFEWTSSMSIGITSASNNGTWFVMYKTAV